MRRLGLVLLTVVSMMTTSSWAHKAHVHGNAKLSVAIEGLKGEIELELPGDSFVGFEHKPKNAKQEQALSAAQANLVKIAEWFVLPAEWQCQWQQPEYKLEYDGNHSEVELKAQFSCGQIKTPAKVEVKLGQSFTKIRQLEVTYLRGEIQQSEKIKRAQGALSLP